MSVQLPWTPSGGAECCCDTLPCSTIGRSLCKFGITDICGFAEFTDPLADPPVEASCPPKYYKTKTIKGEYQHKFEFWYGGKWVNPDDPSQTEEADFVHLSSGKKELILNLTYKDIEGEDEFGNKTCDRDVLTAASGSYHTEGYSLGPTIDDYGNIVDPTIVEHPWPEEDFTVEYDAETKSYTWSPYDISSAIEYLLLKNGDAKVVSTTEISLDLPFNGASVGPPVPSYPPYYLGSWELDEYFCNYSAVLSEEIPYDELIQMGSTICDEVQCFEAEEDPDCQYCCTDRGSGNRDGKKWLDTPEDCVRPEVNWMAWDATDCEGNGGISGRGTDLGIIAKDMTPGSQYKFTVFYKNCEFPKDPETGNTIYPSCTWVPPCGGEEITITDEVTFDATHWAEIHSKFCDHCAIMLMLCQLEDEADIWNHANPSPDRYATCKSGGFKIPARNLEMTWYDHCTLEEVADANSLAFGGDQHSQYTPLI